MKIAAGWFRDRRGFALGLLIGALTLGKAFPHLLTAMFGGRWREPMLLVVRPGRRRRHARAGDRARRPVRRRHRAIRSARDPPDPGQPRRPARDARLSRAHVGALRDVDLGRGVRHGQPCAPAAWPMPAPPARWPRFSPSAAARPGARWPATSPIASARRASRCGPCSRARPARRSRWWSSAARRCWLFALVMVWGFAVVADSAQFSALVSEHAPPDHIGTALTLQTCVGFLLTMVTIEAAASPRRRTCWRVGLAAACPRPAARRWAMAQMEGGIRASRSA